MFVNTVTAWESECMRAADVFERNYAQQHTKYLVDQIHNERCITKMHKIPVLRESLSLSAGRLKAYGWVVPTEAAWV